MCVVHTHLCVHRLCTVRSFPWPATYTQVPSSKEVPLPIRPFIWRVLGSAYAAVRRAVVLVHNTVARRPSLKALGDTGSSGLISSDTNLNSPVAVCVVHYDRITDTTYRQYPAMVLRSYIVYVLLRCCLQRCE